MKLSDFDYDLPDEQIARWPAPTRTAARLLDVGVSGGLTDRVFSDLPQLLNPGDLLVMNDTRVVPARLRGRKATGGMVELLVERVLNERSALVHLKSSRAPKVGATVVLGDGCSAIVTGREASLFALELAQGSWSALMESYGEVPLPPYIGRDADAEDRRRYQTVYAREDGAVAAPTAGLHFDALLLGTLERAGIRSAWVTLHVGAGTFATIRDGDIAGHVMHSERVHVSDEVCAAVAATRQAGGRVVAVGTTVVRSLESAAQDGVLEPMIGDTQLFIQPGFPFRVVDAMITNFHLPQTTLMMLVAAFAGHESVMDAYRHAVDAGYRFFSYGDSMFLRRASE
jgi:S-adenosylmethionine:tRNA ribosyltransferase-isomerase